MKAKIILSWVLRILIAVAFMQTLRFKFTGHPDSVHIFSALGVEPWGRIGLGVVELITAILIILPRTKLVGIFSSFGIILGAIFSHFLVLGVNVEDDSGGLFTLAIIVLVATIILFFIHKEQFRQLYFNFSIKFFNRKNIKYDK